VKNGCSGSNNFIVARFLGLFYIKTVHFQPKKIIIKKMTLTLDPEKVKNGCSAINNFGVDRFLGQFYKKKVHCQQKKKKKFLKKYS